MKLLVFLVLSMLSVYASGWEKTYNKEGISVEVNLDDSVQQRSSMYINATLESCMALHKDYAHYSDLFYMVKKVKLLQQIDENHVKLEVTSDMPWPMSDRVTISEKTFSFDPSEKIFTVTTLSREKGEKDLGKYTHAVWQCQTLQNGKLQVSSSSDTHKVSVPKFVVSMFITDGPKSTLQKFKTLAEEASN